MKGTITVAKRDKAKKTKTDGPATAAPGMCGVRMFWRETERCKLRHTMTCTLPKGHPPKPGGSVVHEEYQDGKWMGGWVDRASEPSDNWQQWPASETNGDPQKKEA